jgi:UDP-N-acetylglucosamine--N-acetylmuramyl-(pentapeptide) pyrophosphoryl-undecaprenol N-acetylglucosamine transferase
LSTPVPSAKTILFAGGGSGGHLYPGIAVAQALREKRPDLTPLFLCTEREIDRTILAATGFEFIPQPIVPPRKSVGGLLRFWTKWRSTNDLVRGVLIDRYPVAVLGLGGYAAGVAVKVGAKQNLPAAILNPDVVPGKANQYLMRFCRQIFCGFDATTGHLPREHAPKARVTGCPLRQDLRPLPRREEAAQRLGLDPRLNTLVVTGASQGAKTVNDAVLEALAMMLQDGTRSGSAASGGSAAHRLQGWQVLHLAGHDHAEAVRAEYRALGLGSRSRTIDFTPDMADVWSVADIAVSRAGASSCHELLACGVPSVLMPYPFHKDKHQMANARELERSGAAVVVEDVKDRKRNAAALRPALEPLLYDASRRQKMGESALAAAKPHAARLVAEALVEMAA